MSKAETASRAPLTFALRLSVFGTYQGRNTPSASSTPPTAAMISERLIWRRSIGRATLLAVVASPRLEPRAHLARPRAGDGRRSGRRGRRARGPSVGERDHGFVTRRARDARWHLAQARRPSGPGDAARAAAARGRSHRRPGHGGRRGLRPAGLPGGARLALVRAAVGGGAVRGARPARAPLHARGGGPAGGRGRRRGRGGPPAPRRARRPAGARGRAAAVRGRADAQPRAARRRAA